MNPFKEKAMTVTQTFRDWNALYQKPYDKHEVNPYTKVRLILLNGAEFEANWFSHQLCRHTANNDLRREAALIRRSEQQQQKALASVKPPDETLLEQTIGYEQLAVDLTAIMAQNEPDQYVRQALDFALLEDFDHLYRFSDLLEMEHGVRGERLVGCYTEIMPGRPTISEHRYPFDDVRLPIQNAKADIQTKLNTAIITAAEQQTMNYYMNVGTFYSSDLGRKLFTEVAMIEEQHVTHYEALQDPAATWLEGLLMHEYAECYAYYSAMLDETDKHIKALFERHFEYELAHLHHAAMLLKKYEKKDWQQVIPGGDFPAPISFERNIENNKRYIREVIRTTVSNTADRERFVPVAELPENHTFFMYNDTVNGRPANVASHAVISNFISEFGEDYRFEESAHPTPALRNRKKDNVNVGRKQ